MLRAMMPLNRTYRFMSREKPSIVTGPPFLFLTIGQSSRRWRLTSNGQPFDLGVWFDGWDPRFSRERLFLLLWYNEYYTVLVCRHDAENHLLADCYAWVESTHTSSSWGMLHNTKCPASANASRAYSSRNLLRLGAFHPRNTSPLYLHTNPTLYSLQNSAYLSYKTRCWLTCHPAAFTTSSVSQVSK